MKRISILISLTMVLTSICIRGEEQPSIGSVIAVQGTVTAIGSNQASRELKLKSEIFPNDKIITASGAKVQILFDDDSVLSQGEGGEMIIDEYVYDPGNKNNANCGMQFVKGIFRVVTGKITDLNPDRFKVKTRMATIGIRGCELGFSIQKEAEDIYVIGLPHGKNIIIERTQVSDDIINKGKISQEQIMNILKPGVVVSLRPGKKMNQKAISVNEARNLINASLPTSDNKENENKPANNPLRVGENNPDPNNNGDPMNPHNKVAGDPDAPFDPNAPGRRPDPNAPFDPNKPVDPALAMNPDMPFEPRPPADPNAPFNPNMMFNPNMPFDPGQMMDPDMVAFFQPRPWEHDRHFQDSPDGHFKPFFDPNNPATWPPDPLFNPNDPATWPPEFFYNPLFDPNDPATWPDDPFFNPNDPATWPKPPLFDPNNPSTWPDDPNFNIYDPTTWPPPPDDGGGPAANPPPGSEFLVLGPSPIASEFWEWGKWVDADGKLMFPDVFPLDFDAGGNPIHLLKGGNIGDDYYNLVNQPVSYTLETVSGINIAAAAVSDNINGKKLLPPGTCSILLQVGNYAVGQWSGIFRVGDTVSQINDFVKFDVPLGVSTVDANGNLKVLPSADLGIDMNYSSKIYGNSYGPGSVTFYNVNGEMLGNGVGFTPPVDAVIGWFKFEHGTIALVEGTFASDLVQTAP